jgi:hypothetical protein
VLTGHNEIWAKIITEWFLRQEAFGLGKCQEQDHALRINKESPRLNQTQSPIKWAAKAVKFRPWPTWMSPTIVLRQWGVLKRYIGKYRFFGESILNSREREKEKACEWIRHQP